MPTSSSSTTSSPGRRLVGKTALIMGGTGFMGSAFCRAYADHGARIIIHGRSREKLDKISEELRTQHGAEVRTIMADVATEPERLADEAWDAFGVVNVVL